jgi:uncharacterized membrane protein YcaP (DUF421 family)
MQQHQLHRCLLTADKVASEVRSQGYSSLAKVYAVVLEPNGRFSVITQGDKVLGRCPAGMQWQMRVGACGRIWLVNAVLCLLLCGIASLV